jgi:hypothetical protein
MAPIQLFYFSKIVSDDIVNEFVKSISTTGLSLSVEQNEKFPIQGGLEWIAPTALIVYLTKPYFESFLSEMGKDHYNLLKKALKVVANRLLGRSKPKIHLFPIKGQRQNSEKYSMTFSMYVKLSENLNLKLLFPTELQEEGIHEIIEVYSTFIEALYTGQIDEKLIHSA